MGCLAFSGVRSVALLCVTSVGGVLLRGDDHINVGPTTNPYIMQESSLLSIYDNDVYLVTCFTIRRSPGSLMDVFMREDSTSSDTVVV